VSLYVNVCVNVCMLWYVRVRERLYLCGECVCVTYFV